MSSVSTVEPRYNEGPKDWQNFSVERNFVVSRFFFVYFAISEVRKIVRDVEDVVM